MYQCVHTTRVHVIHNIESSFLPLSSHLADSVCNACCVYFIAINNVAEQFMAKRFVIRNFLWL